MKQQPSQELAWDSMEHWPVPYVGLGATREIPSDKVMVDPIDDPVQLDSNERLKVSMPGSKQLWWHLSDQTSVGN